MDDNDPAQPLTPSVLDFLATPAVTFVGPGDEDEDDYRPNDQTSSPAPSEHTTPNPAESAPVGKLSLNTPLLETAPRPNVSSPQPPSSPVRPSSPLKTLGFAGRLPPDTDMIANGEEFELDDPVLTSSTRLRWNGGVHQLSALLSSSKPMFRWVFASTYVAAFIWSCDGTLDTDYRLWEVLVRAVPAYLFLFLGLWLMRSKSRGGTLSAPAFATRVWDRRSSIIFARRQSAAASGSGGRPDNANDDQHIDAVDPVDLDMPSFPSHISNRVQNLTIKRNNPQINPSALFPAPGSNTSTPEAGGDRLVKRTNHYGESAITASTTARNMRVGSSSAGTPGGVRGNKLQVFVDTEWTDQLTPARANQSAFEVLRTNCFQLNWAKAVMKVYLRSLANEPAVLLSAVIRNVVFCGIMFFTITQASRPTRFDPWNYQRINRELRLWDAALALSLVADHLICFLAASSKGRFLCRFKSLVDLLTLPLVYKIVSIAAHPGSRRPERILFSTFRLFRLFRLEGLLSSSVFTTEPVPLILTGLGIDTSVILAAFAAIMYLLEAPRPDVNFVNLGDYLYYAVVTMTTVGYGDYSPITHSGRWVTMGAILTAFIILPYQGQRLLTALHIPPTTVGYQPTVEYIFIYGHVRPRQLGVMLHELVSAFPSCVKHVWVVTPVAASSYKALVTQFLREYNLRVGVSQTCPTAAELRQFSLRSRVILALADPIAGGIDNQTGTHSQILAEDQKIFLKASKLIKWTWTRVPVAVQMAHGLYSSFSIESGAVHCVGLEMLKNRCIARTAADCPGFLPLVFNWYQSPSPRSQVQVILEHIQKARRDAGGRTHEPNQEEANFLGYFHGLRFRIFRVRIPQCWHGRDFAIVARALYRKYRSFFIGLIDGRHVYFNPIGYQLGVMPGCNEGLVLASDISVVMEMEASTQLFATNQPPSEVQFLASNLRLTPDLVGAAKTFLNDVQAARSSRVQAKPRRRIAPVPPRPSADLNRGRTTSMIRDNYHRQLTSGDSLVTSDPTTNPNHPQHPHNPPPLGAGAAGSNTRLLAAQGVINGSRLVVHSPHGGSLSTLQSTGEDHESRSLSAAFEEEPPAIVEASGGAHWFESGAKAPLIVVCGWPNDLYSFFAALEASGHYHVLVLASHDAPNWGRWNNDLRHLNVRCSWLHGTPLSVEDLQSACVGLAHSVVLFADAHTFNESSPQPLVPNDYQTILVRQQLSALYTRIEDALSRGDLSVMGELLGVSADVISRILEGEFSATVAHIQVKEGRARWLKSPPILTELQQRESIELLGTSRDLFLVRALRHTMSKKELSGLLPSGGALHDERGEELLWLREGGRREEAFGTLPPAHHTWAMSFGSSRLPRSCYDASYVIQREYRAGRLCLREMFYPLIGFNSTVSRFAVETVVLDHAVDGCCSPVADILTRSDFKAHPILERYKWKSPLQLVNTPSLFANAPFKELFAYFMKFELKLPIGILRSIDRSGGGSAAGGSADTGGGLDSNGVFRTRTSDDADGQASRPVVGLAHDLVISCPEPDFLVLKDDRVYVIMASCKHALGLLLIDPQSKRTSNFKT